MNGTITEKTFGKMTTSEKLWLLYNTMADRDQAYKKNCKRIYILIGVLIVSVTIDHGGASLAAAVKLMGF